MKPRNPIMMTWLNSTKTDLTSSAINTLHCLNIIEAKYINNHPLDRKLETHGSKKTRRYSG